jgi:2-hydroxy-3-keto-5-methylthiopentenyl-1-phosphate phosphatase
VYKVYCDFDETISTRDVGTQIIERFGKAEALDIWKDFDSGEKTASECLRIALATVSRMSAEAAEALFTEQRLKDGFVEFAQFCKDRNIELSIASDGFSCYIESILRRHNVAVPIWTNDVRVQDDGTLAVNFPNEREGCRNCASCKCALLLTTSDDADTIVYVGDGYSDWCPAMMADVVFACRDLKRQCGELGIPHHPFEDFHEVKAILETYLTERPKYRREQAHRRRKDLITIE